MDTSDDERGGMKPLLLSEEKRTSDGVVGMLKAKKWLVIFACGLLLAVAIIVAFVATKSSSSSCSSYTDSDDCFFKGQIRLPKALKPLTYAVHLQPDLKTFDFNGSVRINVTCLEATRRIVFHQKGLSFDQQSILISEATIARGNELKRIVVEKMRLDPENEQVIIKSKELLLKGREYVIEVRFHGKLNDKLEGFYKSSYKTKKGETRYLATTHFEATAARQAFPCFDEPAMKAKFSIIVVHEPNFIALSNMPEEKKVNTTNNLVETHFQQSVLMSTYLVAFVVCDFDFVRATTKHNVEIRIWAPKDQIDAAGLALNSSKDILGYYDDFFGINYPLPKQDLIAIPDFSAGAMENWGLITYRLTSLLSDPKESSSGNKQWVATVVAHELAHQWFGNLVTMEWWNDLWLNEGFAAYVENVGANHYRPEFKMMEQFIVSNVQRAMHLDQLATSHPISVVVKNPNEISSLFDDISYHKGASLIRMLRSILGEHNFMHGLQSYLKKYAYKNAASNDLWDSLSQNASDVDVKKVMATWTLQMGFPLVTITKKGGKYVATQEHFLVNPDAKPSLKSPFNYKWFVQLRYHTDVAGEKTSWLNPDDKEVVLKGSVREKGWLKVNSAQLGFYRVNYPTENWKNLADILQDEHKKLSASDRAGLLDDAFALARANKISYATALDMTLYLNKEDEYVPWSTALSAFSYIGARLSMTPNFGLYQNYILSKVQPVLDKLGFEDTGSHLTKYLRDMLFGTAAYCDYKRALNIAKEMFKKYMHQNGSVPPNFRSTVYDIGVRLGGRSEWEFMWKRYQTEIVAAEKRKLLSSLSATREAWLLQRCLEYAVNTSLIKSQDGDSVISSVAGNANGRLLAWDFFRLHWPLLRKRYGSEAFSFGYLVKAVTAHFQTEFHYNEVKSFFIANSDVGSAARSLQQAYETIEANIRWAREHENEVVQWLKAHQSKE